MLLRCYTEAMNKGVKQEKKVYRMKNLEDLGREGYSPEWRRLGGREHAETDTETRKTDGGPRGLDKRIRVGAIE